MQMNFTGGKRELKDKLKLREQEAGRISGCSLYPFPLCQQLLRRQCLLLPIAQGYAWRHLLVLSISTKATHLRPATVAEKISLRKKSQAACGSLIKNKKSSWL